MSDILNVMPIRTENYELRLLKLSDINWYISEIKKPFFNEYMDYKYSSAKYDNAIQRKMFSLIASWKLDADDEVRLVIINNDIKIGGLTVVKLEDAGVYEIGYWVMPEYQGKGVATEVLKGVATVFEMACRQVKALKLIIQENNIKSIHTAEKSGFEYMKSVQGRCGANYIYTRILRR